MIKLNGVIKGGIGVFRRYLGPCMVLTILLWTLLALSVPVVAVAEEAPEAVRAGAALADDGTPGTLTLREAWRMALDNHEGISIAAELVNQSDLDVDRAYSGVLPSLTVEGTYTRYTKEKSGINFLVQPEDSSRLEIRLTQPIYSGGREWSALRQAKKRYASSVIGAEDVREQVVIVTARAYYNMLRAGKLFEITEASLKRAREQLRVSSAKFQVGTVTKAEVLRAEAEVAEKVAEVVRARADLRDARETLKRITGIEGEVDLPGGSKGGDHALSGLRSDSDTDTPDTIDTLLQEALTKRRDFRQVVIQEEIASEGIGYAKGNFMPKLAIEGVHSLRDQTPETTFFLDEATYAGLILSFPVFEGGLRRAELAQARSKLREAELQRVALRRDLELEIRRTYNNMETSLSVIDSFEKQLAFANESYTMVFKQYKHGLADNIDLIDAETTLVSAELNLMRSTLAYQLLQLELKRSVGVLLEEVEGLLADESGQ